MSIQNKKTAIVFPLILAFVLVIGIFLGLKLSRSGISERLLIYPSDKINNVLDLIEDSYVDTVSRSKLEVTAIESILQKLDPHSVYIPASEVQEMNEPLEGNFCGIGIQFSILNDTIVVGNTIPKGPSSKVGIRPGDRIIRVNDSVVAGINITNDNIIKKLKGEKGSLVKVSVKRKGIRGLLHYKVTRDIIPLYSIDVSYLITSEIGYIKISRFSKSTSDEFSRAVKKLHSRGMKKLIVDLRDNGGGLLDAAIKIADQFLDDRQLIVYTKGRTRSRVDSYSTPGGECLHDSLIVLLDETSASASEVVAGAIQDNDRGWIVGRRSFGKGLVQEPSILSGGAMIRLTIARYYTPTGRCIQKPYNNGKDNYFAEVHKRVLHGEMEQADSIRFCDSLKFTTHGGRTVYGGGGIMPDVFVPVDTSAFSDYFFKIRDKNLIYQFAFYFSDNNRPILARFKTYQEMLIYLKKKNILEQFIKYAEKKGIEGNAIDLKRSSPVIETYLKASIIRNFFENTGFYPIINAADNTVQKAIEVFGGQNKISVTALTKK